MEPMTKTLTPTWTLADRLKKARQFAGLDEAQLAELLGCSERSVENYERGGAGKRGVSRSIIIAWSVVTGVPLSWLDPATESEISRATQSPWTDDAPRHNPFLRMVA